MSNIIVRKVRINTLHEFGYISNRIYESRIQRGLPHVLKGDCEVGFERNILDKGSCVLAIYDHFRPIITLD